jgi:hypothetical protein
VSDNESERARRIGLNEAVFRHLNEQVERISETFGLSREPLELVCECGNSDCAERIRIESQAYERLRSDPLLFAIVPGHELAAVEEVVSNCDGYDIVRKRQGQAAAVARETDPRGES